MAEPFCDLNSLMCVVRLPNEKSGMDISQYLQGGYYITKLVPRPECVSSLMPPTLLTLSSCFTDLAPGDWALDWYNHSWPERGQEASKFGIPAELLPEMVEFCSGEMKGQMHNAFPSAAVAVEFHRRFVRATDTLVVGIGLHKSLFSSFKDQLDKEPNRGLGLIERLEQGIPMADSGKVQGFEPLGFEALHFHSWICHNLPGEIYKVLGIGPSANGLIATLEDAIRVNEYISRPETGAEPVVWEPWLIAQY
ncbi:MAG TPA: hypothetical protein VKE93_14585 [Candidatus Angelobacter sp.]|nr:hypothetical protein [Candidatus Angelobacter sp.]